MLRKIKRKKMNKRGQFESVLLAIVMIFVVGIILFFFQHLSDQLYSSLDSYLGNSTDYADSEAKQAIEKIQFVDRNVWDWVFLAIYAGVIIQMLMLSFATRINIAFFWIFAILGIILLIVGTLLSNVWQEMAEEEEFSVTVTRFPITNSLLGTYFPTAVLAILFIFMIVLFGKPPTQQQGGFG